jgi:cellulose synthase/poly-beta-1,6-N-acetylglucosamine synthase-like glycosyltransferase
LSGTLRFSIVIPTRNRPVLLDRCLTAIGALDYPLDDFEVVLVDDGTEPEPREIVAHHTKLLPLTYYRQDRQGPARTRNRGLRQARGEYVVFTDDDCAPGREWLSAYDRAFRNAPAAGLGGAIVSAPENGICGITSQMLVTFLYDYEAAAGNPRFFCSNNLAFPRELLLDIGGFDETFPLAAAEDRDICARWLQRQELHFVPEAIVHHRQDLQLMSFCSQHYRYGRGAYQFWARRRAAGQPGLRVEPLAFYGSMFAFPLRTTPIVKAAVMLPLLALSQVACAAGYFAERWLNSEELLQPGRGW